MTKLTKENVGELVQQFNLEHLCNGKAPISGIGWDDVEIEEKFREESFNQIASLLEYRKQELTGRALFKLKNEPLYEWFGNRFVYSPTRECWSYCAGQDYISEMREIRKVLKG